MNFSPKLIKKLQNYFKKNYGKSFSNDEASEALDNLAGLCLSFSTIEEKKTSKKEKLV